MRRPADNGMEKLTTQGCMAYMDSELCFVAGLDFLLPFHCPNYCGWLKFTMTNERGN